MNNKSPKASVQEAFTIAKTNAREFQEKNMNSRFTLGGQKFNAADFWVYQGNMHKEIDIPQVFTMDEFFAGVEILWGNNRFD